jgi:hypothetical protein
MVPDAAALLEAVEDRVRRTRELSRLGREMRARSTALIERSRRIIAASEEMIEECTERTGRDGCAVRLAARELVRRMQRRAIAHVDEQAAAAVRMGDRLSAAAWADIALAVEALLDEEAAATASGAEGVRRQQNAPPDGEGRAVGRVRITSERGTDPSSGSPGGRLRPPHS